MGVQVTINVRDLLEAGCTVSFSGRYYEGDESQPYLGGDWIEFCANVLFPDGFQRTFWANPDATVSGDFNSWSRSRAELEPRLQSYAIPYLTDE